MSPMMECTFSTTTARMQPEGTLWRCDVMAKQKSGAVDSTLGQLWESPNTECLVLATPESCALMVSKACITCCASWKAKCPHARGGKLASASTSWGARPGADQSLQTKPLQSALTVDYHQPSCDLHLARDDLSNRQGYLYSQLGHWSSRRPP